jgi:translocation protein SEC63
MSKGDFLFRLTDPVARDNWEKYGNPDGPGVTEFGIALPVWLVQGNNSIWVKFIFKEGKTNPTA